MIISTNQHEQNKIIFGFFNMIRFSDSKFLCWNKIIKRSAVNPNEYRRKPKNNPGKASFVPTHNFDTNGGVDQKTTITLDFRIKFKSKFLLFIKRPSFYKI